MLRFTICSLLVSLLAVSIHFSILNTLKTFKILSKLNLNCLLLSLKVSAVPLDETRTRLLGPKPTTNRATFYEVIKNSDINTMVQLMIDCYILDPENLSYRKAMEDNLKKLMDSKKYSEYTNGIMFLIHLLRNVSCHSCSLIIVYSLKISNIGLILIIFVFLQIECLRAYYTQTESTARDADNDEKSATY